MYNKQNVKIFGTHCKLTLLKISYNHKTQSTFHLISTFSDPSISSIWRSLNWRTQTIRGCNTCSRSWSRRNSTKTSQISKQQRPNCDCRYYSRLVWCFRTMATMQKSVWSYPGPSIVCHWLGYCHCIGYQWSSLHSL